MNIDLTLFFEQADKVYPFKGEVSVDGINDYLDEFKIVEPIIYKGNIYRVDGTYLINSDISYKYESKCARCFDSTIKEVKTSFSAKLIDYGKQYDGNDDVDDEDIIYYNKGLLDLDKYILMEVASSLPMKTLCNEDCKGLCPKCGIDLNKETCDCQDDYLDPRLEKLKDFFQQE